jgi:hypothetical protein
LNKFNIASDYKSEFESAVTSLIELRIEDRNERMIAIQTLINEYITAIGETPAYRQLERLTDDILYEELTDTDPDKMTNNEYPIMSERQEERRHNNETSLCEAEHVGTDGRNYRKPVRRKRNIDELIFIDNHAKIRNRDRKHQYDRFVKGGCLVKKHYRPKTVQRYLRMKFGIK